MPQVVNVAMHFAKGPLLSRHTLAYLRQVFPVTWRFTYGHNDRPVLDPCLHAKPPNFKSLRIKGDALLKYDASTLPLPPSTTFKVIGYVPRQDSRRSNGTGEFQKNTGPVVLAPVLIDVVEEEEPDGRAGGLDSGLLKETNVCDCACMVKVEASKIILNCLRRWGWRGGCEQLGVGREHHSFCLWKAGQTAPPECDASEKGILRYLLNLGNLGGFHDFNPSADRHTAALKSKHGM
ncbi:unnamed protein product [Somion occarium]|uniref:Uncharacterized protein n=1 Tax=Somion occarium TaxID=3059160 RepID=A0ABP1E0L3_9APHY